MKLEFNILTYLIIIIFLATGYGKYLLLIFSILIVHELGHLFFIKYFKRDISKIIIYPFGGLIKINSIISSNIFEDLLINIGGILGQLLLFVIIFILYKCNIINIKNYQLFTYYNKIIMIFNLIPISPLDGSKIYKNILELFLPYSFTLHISFITNLLIIFFSIFYFSELLKSNILVLIFIIFFILEEYKNRKYLINNFYLERLLKNFNYKFININKINYMKKNNRHLIHGNDEKIYIRNSIFKYR